MGTSNIEKAYAAGREIYAEFGVDTDKALDILESISLSLHCWQGDDVGASRSLRRRCREEGSRSRAVSPANRGRSPS